MTTFQERHSLGRTLLALSFFFLLPGSAASESKLRGVAVHGGATPESISMMSNEWKINGVRYVLAYPGNPDAADEAAFNSWIDSALDRIDELLPSFESNNINVIIDLHDPVGGYYSRSSPAWHRIFAEKWAADATIRVWLKIAERFSKSESVYGYEIVNEPAERQVMNGLKNWRDLSSEIAEKIRAIDPVKKIIITAPYGNQTYLRSFRPIAVPGVAYSVHMYYPRAFTHQGLDGLPINRIYPSAKINSRTLERKLVTAIRFRRKYQAEVYATEFGCVRWAPLKSGSSYLRDLIRIYERNGFAGWMYWGIGNESPFSIELGSDRNNFDVSPAPTDRAKVLRSFFRRNKKN